MINAEVTAAVRALAEEMEHRHIDRFPVPALDETDIDVKALLEALDRHLIEVRWPPMLDAQIVISDAGRAAIHSTKSDMAP